MAEFIYTMKKVRKAHGDKVILDDVTMSFYPGAKIGVVGPNGAGKSSILKIMAGLDQPGNGEAFIAPGATVGILMQEPHLDETKTVRENVEEGLGETMVQLKRYNEIAELMATDYSDELMEEMGELQEKLDHADAWEIDSQLEQAMDALRCPPPEEMVTHLSGGEKRRVALCKLLLSKPDLLLLDEPTNHLDADSITWLRGFLQNHEGGLIVISHDVDLLNDVVNRVWFLDAVRGEADVYNMSWKKYLDARATDEQRRRRERANAEKKAGALRAQAAKLGAKATKAVAAQNMAKRADKLMSDLDAERVSDKVARIRFPEPAACGKTPLMAENLTKVYGSLEIFTGVDLAIDRGSRVVVLGLNGAGKTTLLRILGGVETPDAGGLVPGHGLKIGYFAQEHDTLDDNASVWENIRHAAPDTGEQELRSLLGAFMFTGPQLEQPAGTLSGGEKTRLALAGLVSSAANVLLLDEPTNNLDPVSREQVLDALRSYTGAVVLVTHDPGAAEALDPERVILLPDGTEDHWSQDYLELIQLA